MDGEKKLPRRALIVVGGASVILGLIGIAFNAFTLFRDYTSVLQEVKGEVAPDQFYTAFYIMSGICLSLYTALLVIGIQLIRQRSRWAFGLLGVMVFTLEGLPISAEYCSGNWYFQWCFGNPSQRIISHLGTLDCDMVSSKNHPDCWIDCKQYVPSECVTTRE